MAHGSRSRSLSLECHRVIRFVRHAHDVKARVAGALAGIAAATLGGCGDFQSGARAQDSQPGRLVTLEDGRRINLRCSGRGAPTVVLESGFGGGSGAWRNVQPALARTTRVCSYDRAGSGFSDPGPTPRDGSAIARDLDQALQNGEIEGPFIVVGHSAGGLYARLFAARRPGEVQGLVLLDPTMEARALPGRDGLDGIRRRVQRCLAATEARPPPPDGDPQWDGCIRDRAGAQGRVVGRRPETWRGQLSELDSLFGRTSDQVLRLGSLLDDVPAYVITASDTAASAPKVGLDKPQSLAELEHLRLALSFRPGSQRTVLSSHNIMTDRPEVVIEAVRAMIAAARTGSPPEPLPPSETLEASADPGAVPQGPPFGP